MNRNNYKTHHKVAAATTNLTSVTTTKTELHYAHVNNPSAAVKYLKLYNKASAPVLATDIPVLTLLLKAGEGRDLRLPGDLGLGFSLGLAYAITNLPTDNDATAVAAGDVILDLWMV